MTPRHAAPRLAVLPGLAALLAAFLLQGCGFSPLYAQDSQNQGPVAAMAAINVALIPDRVGQELREALQQQLGRGGQAISARYDLYVSLSMGESDIGINQFTASTRFRQTGAATWTLKAEDASHTTLASGHASALDGFDVINQQFFAVDLSREAAHRRIDQALADQITQQLATYFRKHPTAPAG